MGDRYGALVNSGPGKSLASMLGLPRPVNLRRYAVGQPLLVGPALVRGVGDAPLLPGIVRILTSAGAPVVTAVADPSQPGIGGFSSGVSTSGGSSSGGASGARLGAVVIDVSAARAVEDLESLRAVLAPSLRRLDACARIVLVGTPPEFLPDPVAAATQHALEGIVRSVAKELRDGATANLIYAGEGSAAALQQVLESPLRFLLSSRSAYVDGQVIRVNPAEGAQLAEGAQVTDWSQPFQGKVVVVTGAARGIGAAIVEVFARDGAHVICLDVPAAGDALAKVANGIGGTALQVDITSPDAGQRIAAHVAQRHGGKLDVLVHNAGITRDKLLANTDADRWGSVLGVNLIAQLRINEVLLDQVLRGSSGVPGGLVDGGRIVTVSSTSGIAGNRGQASYAASKAGLIGMVQSLSARVADRGITVNAVAPGFIETEMTARIPLATREVGRRINSLSQGGRPVDVGETIAWLAQSASAGVTGQVVRVCGQSLLGA